MEGVFAKDALNTLHAPRWKLWCARLLGNRWSGEDGDMRVEGYEWRGVYYVFRAVRRDEHGPR